LKIIITTTTTTTTTTIIIITIIIIIIRILQTTDKHQSGKFLRMAVLEWQCFVLLYTVNLKQWSPQMVKIKMRAF